MFSPVALRHPVILVFFLVCAFHLPQATAQTKPTSGVDSDHLKSNIKENAAFYDLIVPAGERLVLRLEQDLDTSRTKVGEPCHLATVHEIFLGLAPRLSIPAGATVRATIVRVQRRKRPFKSPLIEFRLDSLVLPKGQALPLSAAVLRQFGKVTRKGPDLLMPQGTLVEVMLDNDLPIPVTGGQLSPWTPSPAAAPARTSHTAFTVATEDLTTEMSNLFVGTSEEVRESLDEGSFRLKLKVDRIFVQAVVRDSKGRVLEGLEKADFIVHEDGTKQAIREFSPDLRPLALALVVDGSGSIEPYKEKLREAARETLDQLGFEDQVCLFVFSEDVARMSDLTGDFDRPTGMISEIDPNGRTNIYDVVLDAAYYLERSAPNLRHAIIMISDNWATEIGRAGEGSAIRMALQTETAVYSLKLPTSTEPPSLTALAESVWMGDSELVERITDTTGGEIIELEKVGTLSKALTSIISSLKRRYVMSYTSPHRKAGEFHTIEVRLAPRFGHPAKHYTVHARRGYYALFTQ